MTDAINDPEEAQHRDGRGERLPRAHHLLELGRDDRRRLVLSATVRSVVLSAAMIALFYLLPFTWAPALQLGGSVVVGAVLIIGVARWQLRAVAHAAFPEVRVIEALAFSTSAMVVLFASCYLALSHRDPAAFSESLNHTGALYFTVTTLTTIGFGDIAASTDVARVTVMIQIVANFVILSVLVKLIVNVARRRLAKSPLPAGD
jgi:voltage-gated potassium channel